MVEILPKDFGEWVSREENGTWSIKEGAPDDVVNYYNMVHGNVRPAKED